ncbi:MAG: sugar phosphate isomerase/epimerase [Planctomycetaceae bacterium]|nr:sugar phosphate isomerase/epimerase [Planctomycetaceae bacterium]
MHRRDLLKCLATAFGTAILGRRAFADEAEEPAWRIAVGLNGFASASAKYKKQFPIREVLDFARREGFDGVELTQDWPTPGYPSADETDRVTELKQLYDEFGLQIFSIQTSAGGAFVADAVRRAEWIKAFRGHVQFAKAIGCDCIGLWPGGPLRDQTIDEALTHLGRSFGEAARIAADAGLIAAFEIEPPFIFNSEDHIHRIFAAAATPDLKMIYDPSHFDLMNGSTGRPHELLERVGVKNIGYLHFTDCDGTLRDGSTSKHLPCGEGHVDIDASLQVLREGGFRGWAMIDAWQIPNPYDASLKGKAALERGMPK